MPSSVRVGSRPPSSCLILSNSSGVRPCSRTISGVIAIGVTAAVVIRSPYCRISGGFSHVEFVNGFDKKCSQGRLYCRRMKSVIVGTAGHIDHGKTALVKALTGIDADRLEEEKRRGITIDLGFAHLELAAPSGEKIRLGFIDVPGHERFVRNMLAGVGGIDIVLLVIAADEGIKPQTREHFD